MQVSGYSSNLPLSTQVINKYGPTSPEQVNKVVDAASDRVDERQASNELSQATKRDAAAQIYSANTQQRQIETYLAVASESEVDSQPSPLETATELREAQQRYDRAQNIDDLPSRPERPENQPVYPEQHVETRA
ncbi:hypothetical protein A9179_20835 [Pseudomonas alcaligenes]|uniref:Uncharacterized protein n=1 Tax=Aquipseudomonas alcaligenes TaxID=43263 RepID=A0ABR7S8I1_AQUAC|nr:hypothetical protein [Pseudomonas alcaligenes]MBC9252718.1 hypothetical protein [Pseudomonas alcaligenes]